MEIGEGLERLTHGVSNFYLLEDGGKVTLVDAGTPGDWPVLIEALHRRSIEPSKIDAVLLTHAHADHTGFAERARTEADARVWIHKADEESARDGDVAKPDGKMALPAPVHDVSNHGLARSTRRDKDRADPRGVHIWRRRSAGRSGPASRDPRPGTYGRVVRTVDGG